jgi:hypothetical protein
VASAAWARRSVRRILRLTPDPWRLAEHQSSDSAPDPHPALIRQDAVAPGTALVPGGRKNRPSDLPPVLRVQRTSAS